MMSPRTARGGGGVVLRLGCGPRILQTLRLSASAQVEFRHSRRRSHTIRFGHATAWRHWPASSYLAKPSGIARAAAPIAAAAADVAGGGGGRVGKVGNLSSAATPTSSTTTNTTRSINIGAGASATGSNARVTGVSEVAAAGGGGGGSGGDGESSNRRQYWAPDGDTKEAFVAEPGRAKSIKTKVFQRAEAMLALVLPSGFPDSVHHPYRAYAGWQFMGMVASSAGGVMSTQALLYAMGLGAGAIPLAATLNWVIKDGLGQLGGVAFSSFVNTRFDANPKLWRMVAAVSLDASMGLELLSPLAPAYFLPIASVANIGKNVSFLAASASRAAIHNVLSLKGNLADVTAKAGAQTILACMVGTGAGVALSSLLGSNFQAIIPACLCLSAVHLGANHMSMRRLGIPTFDSQRLELVTDAIVHGGGGEEMLAPQDVAAQEQVAMHAVRGKLGLDLSPTVTVGSRLEEAVRDWGELEGLCRACRGLPFLLSVRGDLALGTGEVHVLLLEGCGAREVLAGGYVALLAKRLLVGRGLNRPPPGRRRRRAMRLLLPPRTGSDEPGPTGEILPEVIAEALRKGEALLSSPSSSSSPSPSTSTSTSTSSSCSSSSSSSSPSEGTLTVVHGKRKDESPPKSSSPPPPSSISSQRRGGESGAGTGHDGYYRGGLVGHTIAAEISARAERSGWNTSVIFLEKPGAVRLRLTRQSE